jgi:hypothetical protein
MVKSQIKIFLGFFLSILVFNGVAQAKRSTVTHKQVSKPGSPKEDAGKKATTKRSYAVRVSPLDSGFAKGRAALVVIVKPNVESVRCQTRYTINGDTVRPTLDSNGRCKSFREPGKYKFCFYLSSLIKVLTDTITLNKNTITYITVTFGDQDEIQIPKVLFSLDKPVVYVYPEFDTWINISLGIKGKMIFSYPKYKDGWKFIAHPSGKLETNGREFDYLFWDGLKSDDDWRYDKQEGFIVDSDSLIPFFENILPILGMNARETQDFITYWVPRMKKNESNYVHFLLGSQCEQVATMNIIPTPESLIRVYMLWGNAEKEQGVKGQTISPLKRKGYTVVEWGGTEIGARSMN